MRRDLGSDISTVQGALRREGDPKALRAFKGILEVLQNNNAGVGQFLPELDRDINSATNQKQQPTCGYNEGR